MKLALNCLSFVNGEYSGVQTAAEGFVRALCTKASADLQLLIILRKGIEFSLPPQASKEYIQIVRPVSKWTGRLGRIWFETQSMHRLLIHHKVDLLHNPVYLSCRTIVPQVTSVHDVFALQYPMLCRRLNRWHYQFRLPHTFRFSQAIVTPTQAVCNSLLGLAQVKDYQEEVAKKIQPVHWGIDPAFYQVKDEDAQAVREKYQLPQKYILFAGRQEPKKNLQAIIKAFFAAVCSSGLDYHLACCGPDGWGKRSLVSEAEKLGFADRVHSCGFLPREDLPGLFCGAAALLFPSYAEGFGLPVMEAMAAGTPVICSNIPALKEIAGDAAVLCDPAGLPQMREALEKIMTDPAYAAQLQKKGASRAENFHWDTHVGQMLHVYEKVLAGSSQSYDFTSVP